MRSRVVGAMVAAAILIGGYAVVGGGGSSGINANLFTVASGGTPSCVRQSTPRSYADAVASFSNMICGPGNGVAGYDTTPLDNACAAAAAGDTVGIKPGSYSKNSSDGSMMKWGDCSKGSGAAVNPDCVEQGVSCAATRANWVTFRCAESPCGNINWPAANMVFYFAKFYAQFIDVPFNRGGGIQVGTGGADLAHQTGELAFMGSSSSSRMDMFGIETIGAKDVLYQHLNYGPSDQCAARDANASTAFWCDNTAPYFESQFAFQGTNSPGCTPANSAVCAGYFPTGWAENYVHDASAYGYQNIRYEDVIDHDGQGKQDGGGVHPGCLNTFGGNMITTANNVVFDHMVCERVNAQGFANDDSGVTVQNSVFTCTVASLQNTTGKWDQCGGFSASGISCNTGCPISNVLFRFNTFTVGGGGSAIGLQDSTVGDASFGTHSNVRIVGNLFLGSAPTCNGAAGITFANNTFGNGISTCGTGQCSGSPCVLAAGDPLNDSDITTPGDLYLLTGSSIDPHLDGSPAVATFDATALGSDYALGHDCDGNTRTINVMRYGACN